MVCYTWFWEHVEGYGKTGVLVSKQFYKNYKNHIFHKSYSLKKKHNYTEYLVFTHKSSFWLHISLLFMIKKQSCTQGELSDISANRFGDSKHFFFSK